MIKLDTRVKQKYYNLKIAMEEAYQVFNHIPTEANSIAYGIALQNFQDFCVACVAYIVGDEEYGSKNPCEGAET